MSGIELKTHLNIHNSHLVLHSLLVFTGGGLGVYVSWGVAGNPSENNSLIYDGQGRIKLKKTAKRSIAFVLVIVVVFMPL